MAANGLILFARMASTRLPGKALLDVAGRPLLGRVLDRARRVRGATLVVATTALAADDALTRFAESEGVSVFRGAAEDVAGRALACARAHGFVRFGRATGDSPFMDPGLFARLIERHEAEGLDLATNVFPRSFPPGLSAEVMATDALVRVVTATSDPRHREHVTTYIYANAQAFRIANIAAPDDRYAELNLAVDTADDLARATSIAHRLGARAATAPLDEVALLARAYDASARASA